MSFQVFPKQLNTTSFVNQMMGSEPERDFIAYDDDGVYYSRPEFERQQQHSQLSFGNGNRSFASPLLTEVDPNRPRRESSEGKIVFRDGNGNSGTSPSSRSYALHSARRGYSQKDFRHVDDDGRKGAHVFTVKAGYQGGETFRSGAHVSGEFSSRANPPPPPISFASPFSSSFSSTFLAATNSFSRQTTFGTLEEKFLAAKHHSFASDLRIRLKEKELYERTLIEDDQTRQANNLKNHFRRLNGIATARFRLDLGVSVGWKGLTSKTLPTQSSFVDHQRDSKSLIMHNSASIENTSRGAAALVNVRTEATGAVQGFGRNSIHYPQFNNTYRTLHRAVDAMVETHYHLPENVQTPAAAHTVAANDAPPSLLHHSSRIMSPTADGVRWLAAPSMTIPAAVSRREEGEGRSPWRIASAASSPSRKMLTSPLRGDDTDCVVERNEKHTQTTEIAHRRGKEEKEFATTSADQKTSLGAFPLPPLSPILKHDPQQGRALSEKSPSSASYSTLSSTSRSCSQLSQGNEHDGRANDLMPASHPSSETFRATVSDQLAILEQEENENRYVISQSYLSDFYKAAHYFVDEVVPTIAQFEAERSDLFEVEAKMRVALTGECSYQSRAIEAIEGKARELLVSTLYLKQLISDE